MASITLIGWFTLRVCDRCSCTTVRHIPAITMEVESTDCQTAETLLPRKYQEEIFNRAQAGNIIAALETGSGKTFISTLLIRWATSLHSGSKEKVVIFLVPKVPLVDQQGDFIAAQTPLRVCKLSGTVGVDMADRRGWEKRFKNHDVFVMTGNLYSPHTVTYTKLCFSSDILEFIDTLTLEHRQGTFCLISM
jgi:superfamily II DNA or RNA helicase